jgi:anti-sigma B factor antagonist
VELDQQDQDGVAVLRLAGDVDVSQSLAVRDAVGAAIEAGAPVVVDLSGVRFIDSSGIGILVTAHRRAPEAFAVAGAVEAVRRALELTRTDRILRLFDDVDEAVAAVKG